MTARRIPDPRAFRRAIEPFLLADEARHNLPLGIIATLIERPDVYPDFRLWLVEDGGRVLGGAIITLPHQLVLAIPDDPAVHDALTGAIVSAGVELPGVIGGAEECGAFANLYTSRTGRAIAKRQEQGIYALTSVSPVPAPAGNHRPAGVRDLDLLVEWYRVFHIEAEPGAVWNEERAREGIFRSIEEGAESRVWLWDDNGPVSLSGYGGPTPNGIRIGPVYTPPEIRGRGYATALVAAQSAWLLEHGHRFCFLYTDMANETSNAIYRRIGYRLACGSAQIAFTPITKTGSCP